MTDNQFTCGWSGGQFEVSKDSAVLIAVAHKLPQIMAGLPNVTLQCEFDTERQYAVVGILDEIAGEQWIELEVAEFCEEFGLNC